MKDMPVAPEKTTILVVDDTVDELLLVEGLLEDYYKITTASNGEMALRMAQTEPQPDLILLDVMMPVMDGYEVCRQLKLDSRTKNIPVIFLTSKTETLDETKGLELGAVDYIKKPINPPVLLARVKVHLNVKLMQDFLLNIIDFAPEAILIANPTDDSIMLCNSKVGTIFGYNADDIATKKVYHLISENYGIRKDGTQFPIELKSSYLPDFKKNIFNLCFLIRDITAEKASEEKLEEYHRHLEDLVEKRTASLVLAKEAAESANIAKSIFIATMSHELRTPLNAIMGFSELMSLDESATPKQKETLAIINRSGTHLLGMINDVLDISKIEAGRLEVTISGFDLIHFLEDIFVMFSEKVKTKHLLFNLDIADDMPRFIKTDSPKLRQILINLIGNAVKFTNQGNITLKVNWEAINSDMATLIIEVIDSGVGIRSNEKEHIFHPFSQIMQQNLDTEGTGLGLVISKSLANLMNGNISFESEFGQGSIFKIELPISLISETDIVIEEQSRTVKCLAPDQPDWRLLVVDDNADNRLLLVSLLTGMGFTVREAENGQEAISAFEQWQPHFIWMDMRMPVMDGYEATRKIRKLAGGNQVKIVALTASSLKEQHRDIINSGCDAVLHKPFQSTDLFATLTKYLGVKFLYQEVEDVTHSTTPELTFEMVATALPLELRKKLHEAALLLDIDEVNSIIAEIQAFSPDIANGLMLLASSYQFDKIIPLS